MIRGLFQRCRTDLPALSLFAGFQPRGQIDAFGKLLRDAFNLGVMQLARQFLYVPVEGIRLGPTEVIDRVLDLPEECRQLLSLHWFVLVFLIGSRLRRTFRDLLPVAFFHLIGEILDDLVASIRDQDAVDRVLHLADRREDTAGLVGVKPQCDEITVERATLAERP
ncbi:hypothetical protein [Mesorhizobium onobrychidis]|uniref:Uncharacterized protein n=1 Tax=Mesorhizobium onobrychidis TaxID=2775404 RepID=A0ABY5QWE4_9HYPH|nr:hypothetical protein [Mesorhizobium onobrychidis]UVC15545.1 hypothetical protein IHQ72_34905 [Mesorhizobium onobrychidis]